MLYKIHEMYRSMLQPYSEWAGSMSHSMNNPSGYYGLMPYSERVASLLQLFYRIGKDYEKPLWNIKPIQVENKTVAIIPQPVVSKAFCNLIHFQKFSDDIPTLKKISNLPKILICAPLSGHHATLLKDTVCSFLKDYDVYITDWLDARTVPLSQGRFDLNDYVRYILEFIGHIGVKNMHVISVCQPTVPVLAAVSLMASNKQELPNSLVMMGGPIDARKSPTSVGNLASQKSLDWFENHVIYTVPENYEGRNRRVYPGFLQHAGFVSMNPDRHFSSHWDYYLDLVKGDKEDAQSHVNFYDEYNAVLDMTAEYYLQTIKLVFQDFALPNGTWEIDGKLVKPQDITNLGLLTIEGELDDISGSGQTMAAHDLCIGIPAEHQQHLTVAKTGHYGIFSGRRWRHNVFPCIKEFIDRYK